MKNMFDKVLVSEMKKRVERLTPNAVSRWGKFTVHQMLCHLMDQMSYALGRKEEATEVVKGPPMFLRTFIRLYIPMPKGKINTSPVMLETQPGEWEKDKAQVIRLMEDFLKNSGKENWPIHPFFGRMNGRDWARLAWRHNNHHLSQFGV
jgi:hypothetical protein